MQNFYIVYYAITENALLQGYFDDFDEQKYVEKQSTYDHLKLSTIYFSYTR